MIKCKKVYLSHYDESKMFYTFEEAVEFDETLKLTKLHEKLADLIHEKYELNQTDVNVACDIITENWAEILDIMIGDLQEAPEEAEEVKERGCFNCKYSSCSARQEPCIDCNFCNNSNKISRWENE